MLNISFLTKIEREGWNKRNYLEKKYSRVIEKTSHIVLLIVNISTIQNCL